jgi:aspartyl-tRNA(Asn)/glutamyl-tRNA(Gln) amidotransferase subunit A
MSDLLALDGVALIEAYRARTLSPREAVAAALDRAEATNPAVSALNVIDRAGAMALAAASEERW